jgi:hypothetical protein
VLPFNDNQIANNIVERHFSSNIDDVELMWHRDAESRIISSTIKTNWKIQLEDELPKVIDCEIFIEEGRWHRLIKGDGDLILKITRV